jgi:hypothetical protein
MKLELVAVPVSDPDASIAFCRGQPARRGGAQAGSRQ